MTKTHIDSGYICLAYHEDGEQPCIKCARCLDWIRPTEMEKECEGDNYNINRYIDDYNMNKKIFLKHGANKNAVVCDKIIERLEEAMKGK